MATSASAAQQSHVTVASSRPRPRGKAGGNAARNKPVSAPRAPTAGTEKAKSGHANPVACKPVAADTSRDSPAKVPLPVAVMRFTLFCLREAYSTKKYGNMSMMEIYNCTNVGVDERLKHAAALLINARAQIVADVRDIINAFCLKTKVPMDFVTADVLKQRKREGTCVIQCGAAKIRIAHGGVLDALEKCRWLYKVVEKDIVGQSLVYDATPACIDRTLIEGLCLEDFRAKFIKEVVHLQSGSWRRKKGRASPLLQRQ